MYYIILNAEWKVIDSGISLWRAIFCYLKDLIFVYLDLIMTDEWNKLNNLLIIAKGGSIRNRQNEGLNSHPNLSPIWA